MRAIIVGAGEIGFHFAEWFVVEKKEVVIVDIDSERLRWVGAHLIFRSPPQRGGSRGKLAMSYKTHQQSEENKKWK